MKMTPRFEGWLVWCCLILAGVSLAVGVGWWYAANSTEASLEVAETDFEIADCAPGQNRDVMLRLQNNSGQPMRVLGLVEC